MILASCASSGLLVRDNESIADIPSENASETFYVLGNASTTESESVLDAIKKEILRSTSEENNILFVGDNTNEKKEQKVISDLDRQLNLIKETKATPFFVPGNYDWAFNGVDGLEVIEDHLENELGKEDILTPNNGCPIESIDFSEDIQLITIDSQWYIEDWDKNPKMNDKCDIKTREKFLLELEGELKKSANKLVILAIHHPLYTNGLHGGKFSSRDHVFPLNGNIPLPGIATLITQIRAQGAPSIQDRNNFKYKELVGKLEMHLNVNDQRILVVSGHEENLQYIEQENIKQLISGAAENGKPVSLGNNGLFSFGGKGFSKVEVFKDGRVYAFFYSVNEEGIASRIFQKKIFEAKKIYDLSHLEKKFPKTVSASVYELEEVEKSDFFRSIWGNHYRHVYGTKVNAEVAILDTLYGGLEVIRPGGGHQTRSLRLHDKEGKEYNMRALRKSAVQFLETTTFKGVDGEKYFSNTVTEELISDFYTAAHPYAAFAIPKLAKAAKVYYTNPKLYYVPKQEALGKYSESYGDQLYMIVEKPSDEYTNKKSFGYPDDVESTDDLLSKLREDEDYTLDEAAYIRARIFDMLIGDWDRHSDQWRWAEFEDDDGNKKFVPIPRDRDQVFANFDGSFLNTLSSIMGSINQFGVYGADIKDVKWFNEAGSKLDRALIKRSGKDVWIQQARFLQDAIDEKILNSAFASLPEEVQDSTLQEIKTHFIARKSNLVNIVERYYKEFVKFQMLTGTDKDDHFDITRFPDGRTQIIAYRIKDGEKEEVLFDRIFTSDETEEIWLYGLDDKDVFEVNGHPKKSILIRIIGGQDEDTFNISVGKGIKIYDRRTGDNKVLKKGGAHFRFTNFYEANLYDYKKKGKKSGGISLSVLGNPDSGTILRGRYSKLVNKFIENPYGTKTALSVDYHFLTQGLDIRLNKGYAAVITDFNLIADARYTSRNYTENFFGFGNETSNPDEFLSLDYNRVNLAITNAGIGLERASDYGSFFQIKFDLETVKVIRNGTNFVAENRPTLLDERKYFAVPNVTYEYKNFDDKDHPTKGMNFSTTLGGIDNLDNNDITGFVKSNLEFYNSLTHNKRLVLHTRVNGMFLMGDLPQFYQSSSLGAHNGLRGYRNERFTGKHSLLGNVNAIYNFEKVKTFLFPLGITVYGGYDIGRVWVEDDPSRKWHNSYGGGFQLAWTNALKGNMSVFNSDEGARLEFGFALNF
tara:strand:+ start:55822 stop:59448 length:3627 start_codon:yes stop_codon:yes gene_type:complete